MYLITVLYALMYVTCTFKSIQSWFHQRRVIIRKILKKPSSEQYYFNVTFENTICKKKNQISRRHKLGGFLLEL